MCCADDLGQCFVLQDGALSSVVGFAVGRQVHCISWLLNDVIVGLKPAV
jgi:hypothetical protein